MLRKKRAALVATAILGTMLAVPAGALAGGGLDPGGVTRFKEKVPVNVVFVGFDERDAPWGAVRSELASRSQPLIVSRLWYGDRGAPRARLLVRLPAVLHEQVMGGRLLQLPLVDLGQEADHRVAAGLQRPGRQRRERHRQPLDRRAEGGEAADRLGAVGDRHAAADDLLHQLVGPQGLPFHTYAKTGEPDPDTGYDFGANRDTRKIVAWGGTTPDDEETGLGAPRRQPRLVLRPLRRP